MEVNQFVPPFLETTETFINALRHSRQIFNAALRALAHGNDQVRTMALTTTFDTLTQAHTNLMLASRRAMVALRTRIDVLLSLRGASPIDDQDSDGPPTEVGTGMHQLVSVLICDLKKHRNAVQAAVAYLDHCMATPEAMCTETLQSHLHKLNLANELFLEVSGHSMPFIFKLIRNPKLASPGEYARAVLGLGEAEPGGRHAGAGPEEVEQGLAAQREPVEADNRQQAGTGLEQELEKDVVVHQEPVKQGGVQAEAMSGGQSEQGSPKEMGEHEESEST